MKNVSKHSETEQKKQKGEIPSAAFSDRPDISIQVFYLPVFIWLTSTVERNQLNSW